MAEQLIIAGARRDALEGETFTVTEPATGKPLTEVAKASAADVDLALAMADDAFADGRGAWGLQAGRGPSLPRGVSRHEPLSFSRRRAGPGGAARRR